MIITVTRWAVFGLGYILSVWPSGRIIERLTRQWRTQIDAPDGLVKGGLWIGCLERILIVSFVYLDQYQAIGFLIAAKSILRFGQVSAPDGRKMSEYVIIGTMLSLILGLSIGQGAVGLAALLAEALRG